ncbi:MAG TPA: nucleotidyltransferase family protein [Terriglobia bacterium]|nr:nucleotidyltransferase family protein [Terriglobia bacterium]
MTSMNDTPTMPVVILAGGLATRLRPLTTRIPKALIELDGRPFLWHQLRLLKTHGVQRVILLVGYLGEMIREQFGNGSSLDLSIDYAFDGPVLLGTAGAIRQAMPLLPERFFVLYGDSYLPCDYRAVERAFRASGLPGLMTVYRNEGRYDRSNVQFESGRILKYDKHDRGVAMTHIDYGLGAFERSVFDELTDGSNVDLAAVYQGLLREQRLAAFEVLERFYEIGSPEGLRDTEEYLRRQR